VLKDGQTDKTYSKTDRHDEQTNWDIEECTAAKSLRGMGQQVLVKKSHLIGNFDWGR